METRTAAEARGLREHRNPEADEARGNTRRGGWTVKVPPTEDDSTEEDVYATVDLGGLTNGDIDISYQDSDDYAPALLPQRNRAID